MTMHADQLVGAPVTDSDGLAVGTVEQVFRDDVDGTPSWARIRSAKGLHFIPLAGCRLTSSGGLSVPFDSQKILTEPGINVDRHMSVEQEEQLRSYFGIGVPTQPTAESQSGQTQSGLTQPIEPPPEGGSPAETRQMQAPEAEPHVDTGQPSPQPVRETSDPGLEWMTRSEERFAVNLEQRESGRVRLRKFVDSEPIEQTVTVYHEEYEIESIPVSSGERVSADLSEGEQEVILHEARAIVTKETIPVERVRLSVRRIEEDQTVSGELRTERIEIDGPDAGNGDTELGRRGRGHRDI